VLRGDREYLVGLIDDIIMKDIVAYYGIKNPGVVKEFFVLLMERAGKQLSINKVANILKISPDTAKRYLAMFEETYLIHLVAKAGKTNDTLLSPKKVYATDIGMRNIIVGFRDKGAIFENIVFNQIKNQHPRYVHVDSQEIDFLVGDTLIEAKYGRELEGKQLAAFNSHTAKHKIIINGLAGLDALQSSMRSI
jgi:predicted AAA+ superfamily ATPase